MAPTLCQTCGKTRAYVVRPKNGAKLCKDCFVEVFELEVHQTIQESRIFERGERIAIGASGGKDSTVLASILKTLNDRYDYGLDLMLLSIDEGITGYRDDSLETVKRNAVQYNLPLHILGYSELYGWTMDQVVAQIGKKGNCTYCGVFRRQALDRGAAQLGIKHVVTGHNADDIAETVLMNLLRGDLPRLARATSIVTASAASEIKRSKPLKYAYEKEIVLYAHHRRLDYFTTECIYSPEAFRGSARTLIKDLERIRPSAILDVVISGERMAALVPEHYGGPDRSISQQTVNIGASSKAIPMVDIEGEARSGCGSEQPLLSTEIVPQQSGQVQGREIDMTLFKTTISLANGPAKLPKHEEAQKKTMRQKMQQCQKCGYLSSQSICKACNLLDALNRTRAKTNLVI